MQLCVELRGEEGLGGGRVDNEEGDGKVRKCSAGSSMEVAVEPFVDVPNTEDLTSLRLYNSLYLFSPPP